MRAAAEEGEGGFVPGHFPAAARYAPGELLSIQRRRRKWKKDSAPHFGSNPSSFASLEVFNNEANDAQTGPKLVCNSLKSP